MSQLIGTGIIDGKLYTSEEPYVLDLTPVEEFTGTLDDAVKKEENVKARKAVQLTMYFLEAADNMSAEQLRYLVNNLVGMVIRWSDLYQCTLDDPEGHLEFVRNYRKLQGLYGKFERQDL